MKATFKDVYPILLQSDFKEENLLANGQRKKKLATIIIDY